MLDIIIPAYKDVEGLRTTLQSVYYPQYKDWITITVIDDCSPIKYNEVEKEYQNVTFYHLKENGGPGNARQYGIEHTKEPYIIFVDCGDIILSKYSFLEIKDMIESHPDYYLFFWTWINEKTNQLSTIPMRSTQGWVYRRDFIESYNIKFCIGKDGGYAHEDVGFNRTCVAIIDHLEKHNNQQILE